MTDRGLFGLLHGHDYMLLTTFRANGEPVPTPVWFAEDEGVLYVMTRSSAGKVGRIAANSNVTVAPCDLEGKPLGSAVPGRARLLDPEEGELAWRQIYGKYQSDIRRLFGQIDAGSRQYIAIESRTRPLHYDT